MSPSEGDAGAVVETVIEELAATLPIGVFTHAVPL
jgi:hypothetical protein